MQTILSLDVFLAAMLILLEVMKGVFFFLTMLLALLIVKGTVFFAPETIRTMHQILMPCYLLLCGIMIGYVLGLLRLAHEVEEERSEVIYKQSFLMGMGIGLVLCLLYIFAL